MKLPDPVAWCHLQYNNDGTSWADSLQHFACDYGNMPLYTEAQVKELLAEADKDFSDGMTVVHLQVADQMRKRYEPVLKMALEALVESCGARCNAEYNPCHARLAATAIRKVLG